MNRNEPIERPPMSVLRRFDRIGASRFVRGHVVWFGCFAASTIVASWSSLTWGQNAPANTSGLIPAGQMFWMPANQTPSLPPAASTTKSKPSGVVDTSKSSEPNVRTSQKTLNPTAQQQLQKMNSASRSAIRDNRVKPASFEDEPLVELPPTNWPPSPNEPSEARPKLLPVKHRQSQTLAGNELVVPTDRGRSPGITGSHLGLKPGETATERSLRLMSIIAEMEQRNAELSDMTAKLQAQVKDQDWKLREAAREMNAARRELQANRDEFDRMQKRIADLKDKSRIAEQENAALLRSVAPLLQQMLNPSDNGNETESE